MIARKYLIPLRKEFLDIKNRGKFINSESFSAIVAKNNFAYPRFAIIVGKKNFKLSVTRHKIKRQIADAINTLKFPNNDYIFLAKKEFSILTLRNEIENIISHD
ncbi:MAG: ribonuclease P protein component [bacterium]|nr:ribonuclease P protein component [bacterium]